MDRRFEDLRMLLIVMGRKFNIAPSGPSSSGKSIVKIMRIGH
jgi:hypothetical protein